MLVQWYCPPALKTLSAARLLLSIMNPYRREHAREFPDCREYAEHSDPDSDEAVDEPGWSAAGKNSATESAEVRCQAVLFESQTKAPGMVSAISIENFEKNEHDDCLPSKHQIAGKTDHTRQAEPALWNCQMRLSSFDLLFSFLPEFRFHTLRTSRFPTFASSKASLLAPPLLRSAGVKEPIWSLPDHGLISSPFSIVSEDWTLTQWQNSTSELEGEDTFEKEKIVKRCDTYRNSQKWEKKR
jgi:hypothetical protein